jgi:hypothetical protein
MLKITLVAFNQIKEGMTYNEVVYILGVKDTLQREALHGGFKTPKLGVCQPASCKCKWHFS